MTISWHSTEAVMYHQFGAMKSPLMAYWYPGRWVYIAKDENTYKIGCTSRCVANRITELQKQYKNRFSAVCFAKAYNEKKLEAYLIRALSDYRQGNTEWFELNSKESREKLLAAMQSGSRRLRSSQFYALELDGSDASVQN